jgi:hypothetical protein
MPAWFHVKRNKPRHRDRGLHDAPESANVEGLDYDTGPAVEQWLTPVKCRHC